MTLVEVVPAERLKDERVPGRLQEDARRHLERIAEPLRREGARVATQVLAGDPADRILLHALEHPPSLILMATHGRSGLERWKRGSVAERVLREARAPILLANPFCLKGPQELRFKRILVPLDGSEASARILPLARELALLYESVIVLHFSIPISAPIDGPPILMTDGEARALLEPFAKRLEGARVELVTSVGDAASAILDTVNQQKCDLVAMTTQGPIGLLAMALWLRRRARRAGGVVASPRATRFGVRRATAH